MPSAMNETYDYIIVGGGSAGCVLANRLSADPDIRVLLLEAGGAGRNPLYRVPLVAGKLFKRRFDDWNFKTEPEDGLDGRQVDWPRGRMLGGCSVIAGMLYVRGHPSDYDGWAARGNRGWGYRDVLPYFMRGEDHEGGADAYHSVGGELHVRRPRSDNPLLDAYLEAGRQAGYPSTADFNGETQEGFSRYETNIKDGRRWSAARAYLDPARRRPNLTVRTRAHATSIVFEGQRAVGVAYHRRGSVRQARAEREVILSAGAVNSPQLLMLSGIGPAAALERVGVAVRVDLPGVGQDLQDHLDVSICHACTRPVTIYGILPVDRLAMQVARTLLFGTGPASVFPQEAAAFLRSAPDVEVPDIQAHLLPVLASRVRVRPPFAHLFDRDPVDGHGYAVRISLLRPHSRGSIELASGNPFAKPRIKPRYLSDRRDLTLLRQAIGIGRDILAQDAFKPFDGGEIEPGPDVSSDSAVEAWIRRDVTTEFHPTSTCRMGDDGMAVVDDALRVRGVDGLRVADASIMPAMVGGNTNAPTMMIGEKASDLVLGRELVRDGADRAP